MKAGFLRAGVLALASLTLVACDVWPTQVLNQSGGDIRFRWRHKDDPDWSSWTPVPRGQVSLLAREHYVQDFLGIEVEEDSRHYAVGAPQLQDFKHTCRRSFTHVGDCVIVYSGTGNFSIKRTSQGWVQKVP